MDTSINGYLSRNATFIDLKIYIHKNNAPRIVCVDGFSISVQASESHYSTPRENAGPYTHVECGFPSAAVSTAMAEYAEEADTLATVFGYVPVEVVEAELALHGGIAPLPLVTG